MKTPKRCRPTTVITVQPRATGPRKGRPLLNPAGSTAPPVFGGTRPATGFCKVLTNPRISVTDHISVHPELVDFWFRLRPQPIGARRRSRATLRTDKRRERRPGPKDAVSGWALPRLASHMGHRNPVGQPPVANTIKTDLFQNRTDFIGKMEKANRFGQAGIGFRGPNQNLS